MKQRMVTTGGMLMNGWWRVNESRDSSTQWAGELVCAPTSSPQLHTHLSKNEVLKSKADYLISYSEPFWGFHEKLLTIICMFLFSPTDLFSLIWQQVSALCLFFIHTAICAFPPTCVTPLTTGPFHTLSYMPGICSLPTLKSWFLSIF